MLSSVKISLLSWSSVWSVLVDQGFDIELSDELLDNWIFEVDVGDLDLGLLWDEIHLSLSFLGYSTNGEQQGGYLPLLGA